MISISTTISFFLLAWLAGLFVIVMRKLLGSCDLRQLFRNRAVESGRGINPERLQLLAAFSGILGFYLIAGVQSLSEGGATSLPSAPDGIVGLLAGSNTFYLAGKLLRGQT